jgi:hypothetical protein
MTRLLLALAAAVPLLAPFPPPRLGPATPETKCDWGAVGELNIDRGELLVRTEAGPLTLRVDAKVRVADAEGKALPSVAALRGGQNVRAYYVIDRGAKAQEIDVVP